MKFYEALFEVVKSDYHVSNDDPWYCADPSAIARIELVLEKTGYEPYLDWKKSLEEEEAKEVQIQKDKELIRREEDMTLLGLDNLSPNEIMDKFK